MARTRLQQALLSPHYLRQLEIEERRLQSWLSSLGCSRLPKRLPGQQAEAILVHYIQHLFDENTSITRGTYATLALQRRFGLKGELKAAWESLLGWKLQLPLTMRVPIPQKACHALFTYCMLKGFVLDCPRAMLWICMGVLILTSFYSLLRPGEGIGLRRGRLVFGSESLLDLGHSVAITVVNPKTRAKYGRSQYTCLHDDFSIAWLTWLARDVPNHIKLFGFSGATFRKFSRT